MKSKASFVAGLLLIEEMQKRISRLKPKVKYTLPLESKSSFFSSFKFRRVKQFPRMAATRAHSDLITFL